MEAATASLPEADSIALPLSSALALAMELLELASEQRRALNFAAAQQIFEAAGLCAAADDPSTEALQPMREAIERHAGTVVRGEDAEAILRTAENLGLTDHRTAAWPADMPPLATAADGEPAKLPRCFAASAAALVGVADCKRLLGDPHGVSQLLARLRYVAPQPAPAAEDADDGSGGKGPGPTAAAAEDDEGELDEDALPPPASEDPAALDGYGEGPRILQAFLLELCGGAGGDGYARGRLHVLVYLVRQLAAAPLAPAVVWSAMGVSYSQPPQEPSDADADASPGAAPGASAGGGPAAQGPVETHRYPGDGVIRKSAVAEAANCEALLDAAISCVCSLRPDDALVCLQRLLQLNPFWELRHCHSLPAKPEADRPKAAAALFGRATWLCGGGMCGGAALGADAYASYAAAARLLEAEWRAAPLQKGPLRLWLDASWQMCEMVEAVGEVERAAAHLARVGEATIEQFFPPATPPSAMDQAKFLRHNVLVRRAAELHGGENALLKLSAAHLLFRRARLLLRGGAGERGADLNDDLVRSLTAVAELCPGGREPLGVAARELLVGLHARRYEYAKCVLYGERQIAGLGDARGVGAEASATEAAHATRTAHFCSLDAKHETAAQLYTRVLSHPKRVGALAWLRHAGACTHLGRTRHRDALNSLQKAVEIAAAHDTDGDGLDGEPSHEERGGGGGGGGGESASALAASGGASASLGLSVEQLWEARYTLGLLLQRDGVTQQAMASAFEPLLEERYDGLPTGCRVAALTGLAACLAQLGRRDEALEACERAVGLGGGGEVLFLKALLQAQLGKVDDAARTLRSLLAAIPDHVRALLALSTLLAHNNQLREALGQASAARELEAQNPIATQQVGLLRLRMALQEGAMGDVKYALAELLRANEMHGLFPPPVACDGFVGRAVAIGVVEGVQGAPLAEAISLLKQAASADSASPWPLLVRGLLLRRQVWRAQGDGTHMSPEGGGEEPRGAPMRPYEPRGASMSPEEPRGASMSPEEPL